MIMTDCKDKLERVGLYGGTFSPPHKGHIYAAKTMLEHIPLDRLLIMPAYIPPHKIKNSYDTPKQRYKMCQSAFGDIPKTLVSDYEISKGGISYSIETINYLKNENNIIYMLCGSDMFLTLDKWYKADEIFRKAEIVCVPRFSDDLNKLEEKKDSYEKEYSAKIHLIGVNPLVISSTEIREKITNGENLAPYLTEEVIKIIKEENLYSHI